MTADVLTAKFLAGVSKLAALSLAISYPTQASLPHLISNAYKQIIAVALEANIDIPQVAALKAALANPGASAPVATSAPVAAAKKEEAKKEKSEEEDAGMDFDLFG
jgi:large subunit ribosomal protein LP0